MAGDHAARRRCSLAWGTSPSCHPLYKRHIEDIGRETAEAPSTRRVSAGQAPVVECVVFSSEGHEPVQRSLDPYPRETKGSTICWCGRPADVASLAGRDGLKRSSRFQNVYGIHLRTAFSWSRTSTALKLAYSAFLHLAARQPHSTFRRRTTTFSRGQGTTSLRF